MTTGLVAGIVVPFKLIFQGSESAGVRLEQLSPLDENICSVAFYIIIAIMLQKALGFLTAAANTLQFDMVGGELEVMSVRQFRDKLFQARRPFKVDKRAAFDADEVMMVGLEGLSKLVALFKPHLNQIDDAVFRKELQRSIDACTFGKLARFNKFR